MQHQKQEDTIPLTRKGIAYYVAIIRPTGKRVT